jgi:RNA polymerase sigma-70 factor (ECF subfamily)
MPSENAEDHALVERACQGEQVALAELFERHRPRLELMVRFRMDQRLLGRVDPADILQDAFLETSKRIDDYAHRRPMAFFLWLRLMVGQKLTDAHRFHLGAKMRDVGREVSLQRRGVPEASSVVLAENLLDSLTSPTQAYERVEMQRQVERALEAMDPLEREVLTLRHFEGLSNAEVAQALEITQGAASNRYVRALRRLKSILNL